MSRFAFFRIFLFCCFSLSSFIFGEEKPLPKPLSDIPQFKNIPLADSRGIVIDCTRIKIEEVPDAYNPSIIKRKGEYLLSFRQDINKENVYKRKALIGIQKLDSSFQAKGKKLLLHTGGEDSEDARLFASGNDIFVLFTEVLSKTPYTCRVHVGKLAEKRDRFAWSCRVNYAPQRIEKNWTPFFYQDEAGNSSLYFIYSFNPFKILRLHPSLKGEVEEVFPPTSATIAWETKWGHLCGGTPAICVGEEYLTFFHSSFYAENIKWYVVGALTFDKNPPFRLKRISPYPLLFKKLYSTPVSPSAWFLPWGNFRVMFPLGLFEGEKNGKAALFLSFGENDSALKLVTLDKDALLNSLQAI